MFITFEGIEGCGKSTQAEILSNELIKREIPVLKTSEPGGTKVGKDIRKILLDPENSALKPLAELFLYQADRAQHIQEVIRPALDRNIWVLCDRFCDSTVAYQGYGRGLDIELIKKLNHLSTGGLQPDITFLLDLPVEVGLQRARQRNDKFSKQGEARFENEEIKFHEAVRLGFLKMAAQEERFVIFDGLEEKETIAKSILKYLERFIRHGR